MGLTEPPPGKGIMTPMQKRNLLLVPFLALMGCSVTSLQCGVDGDSSFVNLNTTPANISQNTRQMSELCGFAYEADDNG